MPVEVLYRKYRPQTFAELAGQEPIARTLRNAVAARKVSHAYLFSGPRGTGKTSSGRLLAKAVNCGEPQEGEPCNKCDSCLAFLGGRAMDLIELDAASNRGIDEIRSLREKVGFAPATAEFKVYIIDEAHMLTDAAFNALLKTLEEPPPHVIFVLATTEPHKVPATIASRCQRFDFRRIPLDASVERLDYICRQEGISCPREALELIARTATGSLRDGVNLLEQVMDYHGRELTLEAVRSGLGLTGDARSADLARLALKGDLGEGLALIAAVRDDGLDLRQFQREVVSYLRQLLLVQAGAESALSLTKEQAKEMKKLLEGVAREALVQALRAFGQADLRGDPWSSLPLELALAECILARGAEQQPRPSPAPPPQMQGERLAAAPALSREGVAPPHPAPVAPAPPPPRRQAEPPAAAPALSKEKAAPPRPSPAPPPPRRQAEPPAAAPALSKENAAPPRPSPAPPPPRRQAEPPAPAPALSKENAAPPRPAPVAPAPPPQVQAEPPAPAPASSKEGVAPTAPPRRTSSRRKKEEAGVGEGEPAPPEEATSPIEAVVEAAPGEEHAQPPSGPPSADLARVQARWQEIYQLTRKINFKAGALLNSGCAIIAVDNGAIIFGLRHESLAEKMNSGEDGAYLQALREAVQQVIGGEYDIRCVFDPQAATPRSAAGASGGHLVQAAREMGARLVSDGE
jgi:DNA polymerase-3 subunit gamma/tau